MTGKPTWPDGLMLDQADARQLQGRRISTDSVGYATATINGRKLRIHRWIMGEPADLCVDHINRNKLDCRRANLRLATRRENSRNTGMRRHNTSGYVGVYLCRTTNRWRAEIRVHGKAVKIGRFDSPVAAAKAYDAAAIELHGAFAVTNAELGTYSMGAGCQG